MKQFKTKTLISICTMFILGSTLSNHAFAAKGSPENGFNNCPQAVNVQVNGLVCDFCARALEKVFSKKEEVQSIKVDLDKGLVKVKFNQDQSLNQTVLTELITDSGYNVVDFLPGCSDG